MMLNPSGAPKVNAVVLEPDFVKAIPSDCPIEELQCQVGARLALTYPLVSGQSEFLPYGFTFSESDPICHQAFYLDLDGFTFRTARQFEDWKKIPQGRVEDIFTNPDGLVSYADMRRCVDRAIHDDLKGSTDFILKGLIALKAFNL